MKSVFDFRRHQVKSVMVGLLVLALTVGVSQLVLAAGQANRDATAPGRSVIAPAHVSKTGTGNIKKFNAVDAVDNPCTTSTTFVDMPSMAVRFTEGGASSKPVIVTFSGEWIGGGTQDRSLLQLTIDNVVQSGPGPNPFSAHEGVEDSSNGFTFLSDPVAPGIHTARIQWSSVGGANICVDERSTVVLHG